MINPQNPTPNDSIVVQGARVHNLQNIHVRIPRNKITVITGLSGSGKSSLAFDTIYAEGQRRYVESLSSYAKHLFGTLEKPDVDLISGLVPAIAIDQKNTTRSPRSTVGTMSEIYDYLRLLFTRLGKANCPTCLAELKKIILPESNKPGLNCLNCQKNFPELTLGLFSFNNPQGACHECRGLGQRSELDLERILPNPRLTLEEGAIRPWVRLSNNGQGIEKVLKQIKITTHIPVNAPVGNLTVLQRQTLLFGDGQDFPGIIQIINERYMNTDSAYVRTEIEKYMVKRLCPTCKGQRLKNEALCVRVGGLTINQVAQLTISETLKFFQNLIPTLNQTEQVLAENILREMNLRLQYLTKVGLGYLTLDRGAETLAGGEAQRIRLATQLGSGLTGVLYVLDEPSIGLHPQDINLLIQILKELRDLGNTLIIVEHDEQIIRAADYLIDIGPGAGKEGGQLVAEGKPDDFLVSKNSLTAQYLRGEKMIKIPTKRQVKTSAYLEIIGAKNFNLKDITVKVPLKALICVTGVSGSGKSTLVQDTLAVALAKHYHRALAEPGIHQKITGLENLNKVISVDQSPIGRTPRSNPATYTNVFGAIRDLFVSTELAQKRRISAGHFSFNVRGGRCEVCRGEGSIRHEMHFLPDVYVVCETCRGTRFKQEILDVLYRGRNIAEVLTMTVKTACDFFADQPTIAGKLDVLAAVGLGYLILGQPATTLSGGEAQRIKLATELARHSSGSTLYILDEPTTGLHFEDIALLLRVLQALVDKGNTVLVIEHNLDVIKCADWVIDLGPGGGAMGGQIVAEGTPKQLSKNKASITGKYLSDILGVL
ncbi:excinuclease ABC subunit UvrA [Candidatus Berkelbacteria bacterium]|nr:excinuclease ABC subunit UvrA [Candidatus Berkelbacteria bacterium]